MNSTMLILIAYVSITVVIGILALRKRKGSAEDFFLAGRNVGWLHLALTYFATWFSTFAFIGAPGFFFKKGVNWYLAMGTFLLIAPLLSWFLGRKIWLLGRKYGYMTPADLLADYYKSKAMRYFVALICIVALLPYCLIQLVGIGKVVSIASAGAASYEVGVFLAAFATAFYTFFGGVRAIIWTDVVQGMIFLTLIVLAAGSAMYFSGGLEQGFVRAYSARPEIFEIDHEKVGSPLSLIFIWSFGYILLPHLWQRSYMAKSAASFSKSIVIFAILSLVLVTCTAVFGLLGVGLYPSLADSDTFSSLFFKDYLPWVLPMLVVATFAAGMSTIDSQLLTASSIFVRDLSMPIFGNRISESNEQSWGGAFVLSLIVLVTVLALLPESQGSIIMLASKGTAIATLLLVPLSGPLFFPNISREAAMLSMIFGAIAMLAVELQLVVLPLSFGSVALSFPVQVIVVLLFLGAKAARKASLSGNWAWQQLKLSR